MNVEDIYEVSSLSPESAARTDHQRCGICRYLRHLNQVRRNSRTVWSEVMAGFCLWVKKKHIPRTSDFWMILVRMCSPIFTSLDLKLGPKIKSGQGHVLAQPQDAKIIYYSPSCAPIEEKRSQVRTIHSSLVWKRTGMIWHICICMEINEISGKDFSMEDFSTSLFKKMHDVETCRELLGGTHFRS